jgi:hypothetical protein
MDAAKIVEGKYEKKVVKRLKEEANRIKKEILYGLFIHDMKQRGNILKWSLVKQIIHVKDALPVKQKKWLQDETYGEEYVRHAVLYEMVGRKKFGIRLMWSIIKKYRARK